MAERIRVEVAYARPERQSIVELELPAGATVETALRASRLWVVTTQSTTSSPSAERFE